MKKTFLMTLTTALISSCFALTAQADVVCKVSMMGRICFDSNGKELTVAEMQAATEASKIKEAGKKVAKE